MNLRGLCVCSFGLRTIAVLMSLFPSLGISSFRTAVCCDGENEYTTHARACQQDFAFFLDFFAFFLFVGDFSFCRTDGFCRSRIGFGMTGALLRDDVFFLRRDDGVFVVGWQKTAFSRTLSKHRHCTAHTAPSTSSGSAFDWPRERALLGWRTVVRVVVVPVGDSAAGRIVVPAATA